MTCHWATSSQTWDHRPGWRDGVFFVATLRAAGVRHIATFREEREQRCLLAKLATHWRRAASWATSPGEHGLGWRHGTYAALLVACSDQVVAQESVLSSVANAWLPSPCASYPGYQRAHSSGRRGCSLLQAPRLPLLASQPLAQPPPSAVRSLRPRSPIPPLLNGGFDGRILSSATASQDRQSPATTQSPVR